MSSPVSASSSASVPQLVHPHPNAPRVPVCDPARVAEIARVLPERPGWPLGAIANRARWDRPELAEMRQKIVAQAEAELTSPLPELHESPLLPPSFVVAAIEIVTLANVRGKQAELADGTATFAN